MYDVAFSSLLHQIIPYFCKHSHSNINQSLVEYGHDTMDRVTNIAWRTTSGATIGGFEYEYDAAGRIVSRSHALGNSSQPSQMSQSSSKSYTYDDLDRLASDDGVTYTYDAAGNRMTRTEGVATVTYALGVGDRLASWSGGAYTYDVAGNVTRIERDGKATLDLTWNSQYQLVSVSTNGVFAEGYEYDALGRRVSTTTLEGMVRHVYDDRWQVIADLNEQGNPLVAYVWGDGVDRLLSVKVGAASYYPLTDIQGTVWGYVDSQNNVVARWQYDAWGNVVDEFVIIPALSKLRYRFQCREWSAATGLVNFRMRWYDSETGRWLSKDPIGLDGGVNLYAFCASDPINNDDALGLVNINLFPTNDVLRCCASNYNPKGVFSVASHGDSRGLILYGQHIPVQVLAKSIRTWKSFTNSCHTVVQLDACNVGKGQYPQDLANLLQVEVRAPTRCAWYFFDGTVEYWGKWDVNTPNRNDPGILLSFKPQRFLFMTR